ncbi:MAG TPA: limonene-1,2-epoxide hydrolase family protein [Mycobacteriales bacterium]|nr:limonene-1,2-epoxide hydrolase family protein [Mycobacteriales bacterium]
MATPLQVVENFVVAFVDAWPKADSASVGAFFAEDALYCNGPLEPVRGRAAITGALAAFMAMGGQVTVDMRTVLANDQLVMTERVDHFVLDDKTFALPVMGVFEVEDGKIVAWRDYFDLGQFTTLLDRSD